jgi:hypothetical protein
LGGSCRARAFARSLAESPRKRVDEPWLCIIPIVLGGGVPLLGDASVPEMTLTEITRFQRGLVALRYQLPKAPP